MIHFEQFLITSIFSGHVYCPGLKSLYDFLVLIISNQQYMCPKCDINFVFKFKHKTSSVKIVSLISDLTIGVDNL